MKSNALFLQPKNTIEVTNIDQKAFSHHVYINHQFRFIFFTIPKVACTEWIQLFIRMSGVPDWRNHPHHRSGRPFLSAIDRLLIEEYLNDSTWTKAVFFRDPALRLLSAYLNKIINDNHLPQLLFGRDGRDISFEDFVNFATDKNINNSIKKGLHAGTDPHWKPQVMVANIENFLPCMNFIGDFSNLASDTERLLKNIDIWDNFGATGWGNEHNESIFSRNNAKHFTGAENKFDEYYTHELFDKIKTAYQADYQLLDQYGISYIRHKG